jgi:hypothetical protein
MNGFYNMATRQGLIVVNRAGSPAEADRERRIGPPERRSACRRIRHGSSPCALASSAKPILFMKRFWNCGWVLSST